MTFIVPTVPIKPYAVYLGTTVDTAPATTTITFSSVDLGRASSDRLIVIAALNRDTGSLADTFSTVTINGVSATQVVATTNGGSLGVTIYSARVPTGTSGDVVLTVGDNVDHVYISVYALYGLRSPTAVDTDTVVDTVQPISFSALAVPDDGIAIATYSAISASAFTPTGLVTSNNSTTVETASYASAVGQNGATATSSATLGATHLTTTGCTAAAASWR